jgi:hypothetical protein
LSNTFQSITRKTKKQIDMNHIQEGIGHGQESAGQVRGEHRGKRGKYGTGSGGNTRKGRVQNKSPIVTLT